MWNSIRIFVSNEKKITKNEILLKTRVMVDVRGIMSTASTQQWKMWLLKWARKISILSVLEMRMEWNPIIDLTALCHSIAYFHLAIFILKDVAMLRQYYDIGGSRTPDRKWVVHILRSYKREKGGRGRWAKIYYASY